MRRLTYRLVCALLLCISLTAIALPLRAEIPAASKADCCAMVKTQQGPAEGDACPMKPIQQAQCCAACALTLTLFLAVNQSILAPTSSSKTLTDGAATASLRPHRPPVPPPRLFFG
jgi:hypothetical protein